MHRPQPNDRRQRFLTPPEPLPKVEKPAKKTTQKPARKKR